MPAKKPHSRRASIPVGSTILSRGKRKVSTLAPVVQPVGRLNGTHSAADLVELAGQALLALGRMLRGKPAQGFTPVSPLLPPCSSLSLTELLNEFLRAKARAGKSDRYLRQLRVSLKNFVGGLGNTWIDQVEASAIEKWMQAQEWSSKTCRGYLGDVKTLFNFGVRRGYLHRNPALGVELPDPDAGGKIEIHTPDQVRAVLDTARRMDLDVCRHLAVRYFAGIRSAEVYRLREPDLKLDHNLIEVPAVKAKTRARRLVTIQPNLRAWLDLGGELRAMSDHTVRNVIRLSKVPWPHNVARHSYISYHLAKFESASKTALEAGTSEQMIFKHYRALVLPAAAAEYWGLVP
jgi:integrase